MTKNFFFLLCLGSLLSFSSKSYSEVYSGPYCCCNESGSCHSSDKKSCCTNKRYPIPTQACACPGTVNAEGHFGKDRNSCGHQVAHTICGMSPKKDKE